MLNLPEFKKSTPKIILQILKTFLSQAQTGDLKTKNYTKKYKGLNITVSFDYCTLLLAN